MLQSSQRNLGPSFAFAPDLLSDKCGEYIIAPTGDCAYAVSDANQGKSLVNVKVLPEGDSPYAHYEPGAPRREDKSYPMMFNTNQWARLDVLEGWEKTQAHRINSLGDALGTTLQPCPPKRWCDTERRLCGVVWERSMGPQLLEPLGLRSSLPYGWNGQKCIVGSEINSAGLHVRHECPLLWESNTSSQLAYRPKALPLLPGLECGAAYAINDSRVAVGIAFNSLIRDADRRVPVVWIGDTVLQLPTPGGFAEAFSITNGHLALGVSDGMLMVWDLSEVVAGGDPAQIKCIALGNLGSRLKLLGPPNDSWIIEREGMVAIATREALCFTSRHTLHELADAPAHSLEECFESPGWKVTEVSSDQRLICERESEGRKLSAIFPVPIKRR